MTNNRKDRDRLLNKEKKKRNEEKKNKRVKLLETKINLEVVINIFKKIKRILKIKNKDLDQLQDTNPNRTIKKLKILQDKIEVEKPMNSNKMCVPHRRNNLNAETQNQLEEMVKMQLRIKLLQLKIIRLIKLKFKV